MKQKKKFLFVFTVLTFLSLSACNLFGQPKDQFLEDIKNVPVESDVDLLEELTIVNGDTGVYGNIYLPEEVNGAVISWWSSDHDVIYPYEYDTVAAGEVIRQNQDVTVSLKAKIHKDGVITKFEQEVLVKEAPYQLEDDDFEAYLFGHFVGEAYGRSEGGTRIATGEQMFFALADVDEGFHFKDLNGSKMNDLKPVLSSAVGERGVRDPFICRSPEGDTFYLIGTDLSVYTRGGWGNNTGAQKFTITGSHSIVLWESHDLVNWTEGRLIVVASPDAGMAWAPEMIYHEESGQYAIFFSSTILNEAKDAIHERDCIYYTTTRDFTHFSETKKFIKNQPYPAGQEDPQKNSDSPQAINNDERKIIDAAVMKIDDYYYSATKDGDNHENNGGILIQRTQDLFDVDSWEKVMNLQDLGYRVQNRDANNKCLEGPEWFYFNKSERRDEDVPEIGLMVDYYANTSVGYIPFSTTDIEDVTNANQSWRQLASPTEYSWDAQTKRHGTILRITASEAERLKEAYPNS
ncbi:MAG: glycoside hydrolase family 43 protein [Erysipelotrichia bacterium]|nr:glycoside hydrolase family 43 protein [Erysipelotrichia bacterium]